MPAALGTSEQADGPGLPGLQPQPPPVQPPSLRARALPSLGLRLQPEVSGVHELLRGPGDNEHRVLHGDSRTSQVTFADTDARGFFVALELGPRPPCCHPQLGLSPAPRTFHLPSACFTALVQGETRVAQRTLLKRPSPREETREAQAGGRLGEHSPVPEGSFKTLCPSPKQEPLARSRLPVFGTGPRTLQAARRCLPKPAAFRQLWGSLGGLRGRGGHRLASP